jgi:DNA replication protein DnaC
MTTFLEDQKRGGLEKAGGTVAQIFPDLKPGAIVDVICSDCGKAGTLTYCPSDNERPICKECSGKKIARLKEERERPYNIFRLGGDKAYNNFTLEKFTNKAATELCSRYPNENLFLWGTAGTGKTHLATALIRQYREGRVVKPQHIYRACRGLKDGKEEQAAINEFRDCPYLGIDDLGADKKTDFSFSTLYEIIDGRDMYERKGLIITSNLSLGDLAARLDDDRIISRINGMCKIIELTGKDGRDK